MSNMVVADCYDISPSSKPILMELYQAPPPQQRLPLLLEISLIFGIGQGSIYLIRGGKKLPVGLVLHWVDVEAMERVFGTAGLGELGIDD